MKKLLLFAAFSIALASQAQQVMKLRIDGKDTTFRFSLDSFINSNKSGNVVTTYKMPNAMQGVTDKQQLVGNNNNGFSTYKSQVDGMAVVKPDANNTASLKNALVKELGNNKHTYNAAKEPEVKKEPAAKPFKVIKPPKKYQDKKNELLKLKK